MADRWRQKVEVTGLQGLADLERIEGPFLNALTASDLEGAAVMLRLLLAHMASTSKRVMLAMVLDHLDVESLSTRAEFPVRC
ncbi:hypothetical protein OMCYN_01759 [cyanobiont of Ornithocercus magnificus]|nr:hypothetical protein OMCYN_01759 [cyanobiont of Ornithocercus magnificus]